MQAKSVTKLIVLRPEEFYQNSVEFLVEMGFKLMEQYKQVMLNDWFVFVALSNRALILDYCRLRFKLH